MRLLVLLFVSAILLSACSGVKKTQQALNQGDYQQAIDKAITQLQKNKSKKSYQPYIPLLETAFDKTIKQAERDMTFLKSDGNPAHYVDIYKTYVSLDYLQEAIKPLLPLYIENQNRNADFKFKSYTAEILSAKNELSNHLHKTNSEALSVAQSKLVYRSIYRDLSYLDQINPNFKDVDQLLEDAHLKGTNHVFVQMENQTDVIIPQDLEADLLNFNTYGLDDFWTVYHNTQVANVNYDYTMAIQLRDINISPEQIRERIFEAEKKVEDGWAYRTDRRGNYILDDNGDKIKDPVYKIVGGTFYEFIQNKSTEVSGNISFLNHRTQQITDNFPLASAFVFEHSFANYEGDRRALENEHLQLLNYRALPFPTNEQMVFDTGEDLKATIKSILSRKTFDLRG